MRLAPRDQRDHIVFTAKTTTDLRIGATEPRSDSDVSESTFARFLASSDFRLLQQNRHFSGIGILTNVRFAAHKRSFFSRSVNEAVTSGDGEAGGRGDRLTHC